ncbi:hypothetical protein SUDANB121_01086 [Nocardiopsis dassonvillei]|uniref:hypothetical protein n=1 Tax=Nocardiopsis dassonvillei TaxID=2014 RepID=UPI003F55CC41
MDGFDWPLEGGQWEGAYTTPDGTTWQHIPGKGWEKAPAGTTALKIQEEKMKRWLENLGATEE